MQKCRYNGTPIYAFNVKGKNETINYSIEKQWKKAGEMNELICDECEASVIFRCGKVNIPHFAHKSDFQGGNPCSYSDETEEHIEGKKLLLNYMKLLYPDIYAEVRYKLPERKRADLYFKFEDGQELIIEFQRQRLSVSYWDNKREFYKKLGLNNIWFLSGKKEDLEELIREYQLTFWNRMILNDSNNTILYLDVEQKQITIIKKVTVIDNDTNELIYDKLFNRTYGLTDIKILPDGSIECDFNASFNTERDKFVQEYLENKRREAEERERLRIELEEKKKKRLEEQERRRKEEIEKLERLSQVAKQNTYTTDRTDAWSDIGYSRKSYSSDTYKQKPKKSYEYYSRNDDYYKDKVNKAISGYKFGIDNLVRILTQCGSSEYSTIKKFFEAEINKGNIRAENVYREVLRLSGLD
ncbi:hypothetical protein CFOLD11_09010 [Clostridium folliculivorans]|uniref:Competence protein n=1 Tax=Clostridium folliculivorans TaxID=2886038 RepID=A0A9W6D995_9CLOT|nr:competence protein CoiA [Clostridium folliculivorans]GKU24075.1 hypothetical protein CFOLD11_09010 [Clostridium folliculivorans]